MIGYFDGCGGNGVCGFHYMMGDWMDGWMAHMAVTSMCVWGRCVVSQLRAIGDGLCFCDGRVLF